MFFIKILCASVKSVVLKKILVKLELGDNEIITWYK